MRPPGAVTASSRPHGSDPHHNEAGESTFNLLREGQLKDKAEMEP